MALTKILFKAIRHRELLFFAAGVATTVGKHVLESEEVRQAAANAVSEVRAIKHDAEDRISDIMQDDEKNVQEVEFEQKDKKVQIEID